MPRMLLIIEPTGQRATRGDAEGRGAYAGMQRFNESLKSCGLLRAVESLPLARQARAADSNSVAYA